MLGVLFCSCHLLSLFFLKNLTLLPDTLLKLDIQRSDTYFKARTTFKHFAQMYLILEGKLNLIYAFLCVII